MRKRPSRSQKNYLILARAFVREGLYLNGALILEGHAISAHQLCTILGGRKVEKFESLPIAEERLKDGRFPKAYKDLIE